jgi:hypothetical protein
VTYTHTLSHSHFLLHYSSHPLISYQLIFPSTTHSLSSTYSLLQPLSSNNSFTPSVSHTSIHPIKYTFIQFLNRKIIYWFPRSPIHSILVTHALSSTNSPTPSDTHSSLHLSPQAHTHSCPTCVTFFNNSPTHSLPQLPTRPEPHSFNHLHIHPVTQHLLRPHHHPVSMRVTHELWHVHWPYWLRYHSLCLGTFETGGRCWD